MSGQAGGMFALSSGGKGGLCHTLAIGRGCPPFSDRNKCQVTRVVCRPEIKSAKFKGHCFSDMEIVSVEWISTGVKTTEQESGVYCFTEGESSPDVGE